MTIPKILVGVILFFLIKYLKFFFNKRENKLKDRMYLDGEELVFKILTDKTVKPYNKLINSF
jgi:hypothetical protein